MSEMGPETRRLLELGRHGDDPEVADEHRVGRSLARRLGAEAAAAAVGVGAAKSAAGATAGLGKLIALGVVGLGVVLGLAYGLLVPSRPTRASSEQAGVTSSQASASATAGAARGVSSEAAVAPSGLVPEPSATVSLTRSASTARLNPVPEPPSGLDPLQAETAALRSAQRAIRSGDPARALALIREQDATYRGGALGQERAAARIFALCDLGRTEEARAEARRFARQWPRSPLLGRVQSGSCAP
jgi:hypothetical protein